VEVNERIDTEGKVVRSLDEDRLVHDLKDINVDAVAVVLLHSWRNASHELQCEKILRGLGHKNIYLSHRTVNSIKVVSRGQSAVVDAYLSTVLVQYLDSIRKHTGKVRLEFMQSNGVLTAPEYFAGKNAILSGPAGGVLAVASIANQMKITGAIGFDMGGTSTDVSRFDGEFERIFEQVVSGITLQAEMLNVKTVAAGGGSILKFDGQKMIVGPDSAGALPGPASYGFDGPLTITDANLLCGRLIPELFPETFGPERNSPLDVRGVRQKFLLLTNEINRMTGLSFRPEDVARGFLRVANEKMAIAIKEISVSRGFDVRDYALLCFGGAGGQHACSLAGLLEINKIIIHPLGSLMSAYGIGLSVPAWKSMKTILQLYTEDFHDGLSCIYHEMEKELIRDRKIDHISLRIRREIDIRPKGADAYLTINFKSYEGVIREFSEKYRKLFGVNPEESGLEAVNLRVEIHDEREFFPFYDEVPDRSDREAEPVRFQKLYLNDGEFDAPVYLRHSLPGKFKIAGPAFIIDETSTVVIEPDFLAEVGESGIIEITRTEEKEIPHRAISAKPDPVLLEVFNNLFMGIATEMGHTLQNTAYSVNVKERLDFSCAVFDARGNLVANAPHIPVHLGSMADTVKTLIDEASDSMKRGDFYLTNNPYRGGSHLPDMTVICPVYSAEGEIVFFTASRGHHSDVGGTRPGSMPPSASHIDEEGVMVDNFLLVRDGVFREKELRKLMLDHPYPARNIIERIHDFRAQIAACNRGGTELGRLIKRYGLSLTREYMGFIQDNAEYSVKKALQQFLIKGKAYRRSFEDCLDDGTPVRVTVTIEEGGNPPDSIKAIIDFSGSGNHHLGDNLNAPESVTRSAVLYVLRALVKQDIPLNSGCMRPVDLIIPEGSILRPAYPAPVASGNVETSQRVVDVLLGALGVCAASQGTMNNLLFEVEGGTPYYETIAGGAGAMEGCPGASGVQVHMTNTRITDPEILEFRHRITDPEILEFRHSGLRLERFTLRKGSGGRGRFNGGEGVIREIRFLNPAAVSVISERRVHAPYGSNGGEPGKRGVNILQKADGLIRELGHREALNLDRGDLLIIKTPGGGGFGKK
jgi:5-oxoprolinase (ATP-hydrolysing)